MSAASVLANIVDHLAWPVVVSALAVGFRKPLRDLIGRIRTVKVGNVQVELDSFTNRVAALPPLGQRTESTSATPAEQTLTNLQARALVDPGDAVIAAHSVLAAELQVLASERLGSTLTHWSPSAMTIALEANGVIKQPSATVGQALTDALGDATTIARKVQDGATIRPPEAVAYVETIGVLLRRIQGVTSPEPT